MTSPFDTQDASRFGPDPDRPRREWPEAMAGEAEALARDDGGTADSGGGRPRELAPRQLNRLLEAVYGDDPQAAQEARERLAADRVGKRMLATTEGRVMQQAQARTEDERTRDQYWAYAEERRQNDPQAFAELMQNPQWSDFYGAEARYRSQPRSAATPAPTTDRGRAAVEDAYETLLESPDWARLGADEQDALDPSRFADVGAFSLALAGALARASGADVGTRGARTSPALGAGGRQFGPSGGDLSAQFREQVRTRQISGDVLTKMGAELRRYGY